MTAHRDALTGLTNGSRTGKREQTVLTPPWVLDLLWIEWGVVVLDPCAEASPGNTRALVHWTREVDGLSREWPGYNFANPPFDKLRKWLEHAAKQRGPTALLGPVRPNRKWYRAAARSADAVIELDPLAFQGFDQPFPAPLSIMAWGWVPNTTLWAPHGDVHVVRRPSVVPPVEA